MDKTLRQNGDPLAPPCAGHRLPKTLRSATNGRQKPAIAIRGDFRTPTRGACRSRIQVFAMASWSVFRSGDGNADGWGALEKRSVSFGRFSSRAPKGD
jgi:hypothetical protein